jgi:hypothetical protein
MRKVGRHITEKNGNKVKQKSCGIEEAEKVLGKTEKVEEVIPRIMRKYSFDEVVGKKIVGLLLEFFLALNAA